MTTLIAATAPARDELTPREKDVITLICQGYTDHEAAQRLSISPFTINSHVKAIFSKLNAKNRAHAASLFLVNQMAA